MHERNFMELLQSRWNNGNYLCVGLDPVISKIPKHLWKEIVRDTNFHILYEHISRIVKSTKHVACAYKPNFAFYASVGQEGIRALRRIVQFIHRIAPEVPVIIDQKIGDIGDTNIAYYKWLFEKLGADAITVNPLLGKETFKKFLENRNKGIIVLCKTSNPGSGEFQNLWVRKEKGKRAIPLYQHIARTVQNEWNENGNCALVVGAPYPEELAQIRKSCKDIPILIPGIGKQGGDLEATVKAGKTKNNRGILINSSSGITHFSDTEYFEEATKKEAERINNLIREYMV